MKRLAFFLMAMVLVGTMLLVACQPAPTPTPTPTPPPELITWTYANVSRGSAIAGVYEEIGKALLERTGGRLTIEAHHWSELGYKGPELLKVYGEGVENIGELGGSYLTGIEPILATGGLPLLSTAEQIPAKIAVMRPFVEDVLDKHNIKYLSGHEFANILWVTFEVNTMDDVKKLKLRTSAKGFIAALEHWGAQGIALPAAEVYQGIATGILNSVAFAIASGRGFGITEVVDHVYLSPALNANSAFHVVNKDAFNALPADVQQILVDTFAEYEIAQIDALRTESAEGMAEIRSMVTVHDTLDAGLLKQMILTGASLELDKLVIDYPETKDLLNAIIAATQ